MVHQIERIPLKSPMPGTDRYLTVHRFGNIGSRPKAYLHAALHADEWPGLMALQHLIPLLLKADAAGHVSGEIIVLPYANPIGLTQRIGGAAAGRYALDGSGNFNRNWPDLSDAVAQRLLGRLTGQDDEDIPRIRAFLMESVADLERRTDTEHWRAILMSLAIDADIVLDIHCDQESLPHIYCHEEHEANGKRLAAALDIPVVMLEQDAGGFSFDDAVAGVWRRLRPRVQNAERLPMANFACTLELRGKDDVSDAFGAQDAQGILRFLAASGLVNVASPNHFPAGPKPYRLEEVDVISTETGGLIAYKAEIGDIVSVGQPIAEIIDITASDPHTARTVLSSRTEGLFFARSDLRLVEPGTSIAKIAGRTPLTHRKMGALLES